MNIEQFTKLPLWQIMMSRISAEESVIVHRHVEYIIPLMERFSDTFPRYTLHNREHIYNVIRLMGSLLEEGIENLSGLESMILVLSAVYHDYGMIYNEEEINSISIDPEFTNKFLTEFPSARLQYEENGRQINTGLLDWYCRWAHAKRVHVKISETEAKCGELMFQGYPIRIILGNICESHNETIEVIRVDDTKFNPNYLGDSDLRFCALILRLADILDFDNSRSPQSVYDYLDLDNPKNKSEATSKVEWNKHMSSRGFRFSKKTNGDKILIYSAVPKHPYIENAIRSFLDLVDYELSGAERLLHTCSPRWQGFSIPKTVDRQYILSDNYISGKFQFNLSEEKILDLLTGSDLYNDHFVFIRELLQNAIDTSRHRAFIERIKDPQFHSKPIEVSFFNDEFGYYWFRIDDYGMGMNKDIITNHLLNKGNSYYNSDLFKIEKLKIKEKSKDDFTPISRFGIGLLSCFIACDKIEISTTYQKEYPGEFERNRMSIEGRGGFWVIQSESLHHKPEDMPFKNGREDGYRKSVGTSIACRLKTSREYLGLDISGHLNRFLLAPEIPIIFNNEVIGGRLDNLVKKPWCQYNRVQLPKEFIAACSELLNLRITNIEIEVNPIDITNRSGTDKLTGQIVLVIPRISVENQFRHLNLTEYFSLNYDGNPPNFKCTKKVKIDTGEEVPKQVQTNISEILNLVQIPQDFYSGSKAQNGFIGIRLSHNGIALNDNSNSLFPTLFPFDLFEGFAPYYHSVYLCTGIVCFKDSLLPDLLVSRNTIKRFNEELIANIIYATRDFLSYNNNIHELFSYMSNIDRLQHHDLNFTVQAFENIKIYERDQEFWNNIPFIMVHQGAISLNDAIEMAKFAPIQFRLPNFRNPFFRSFSRYILIKNFEVSVTIDEHKHFYYTGKWSGNNSHISKQLSFSDPMSFIQCDNSSIINLDYWTFNINTPLIKWYLNNSQIINDEFEFLGRQFRYHLLSDEKVEDKIQFVNAILDRFRVLLSEDRRPPTTLNLTAEVLQ